jgi:hypothetical protein
MKISSIFLEHQVEELDLLGRPELGLLLGLNRLAARYRVGFAHAEGRFCFGLLLNQPTATSNSMPSIRLNSVVRCGTSSPFFYSPSASMGSISKNSINWADNCHHLYPDFFYNRNTSRLSPSSSFRRILLYISLNRSKGLSQGCRPECRWPWPLRRRAPP